MAVHTALSAQAGLSVVKSKNKWLLRRYLEPAQQHWQAVLQGRTNWRKSITSQSDEALSNTCLIPYSAPALGPNYNLFDSQTALFSSADISRAVYGVNYFLRS